MRAKISLHTSGVILIEMSLACSQKRKQSHPEETGPDIARQSFECFRLRMREIPGLMDIVTFFLSHRQSPLPCTQCWLVVRTFLMPGRSSMMEQRQWEQKTDSSLISQS
jgi:hypothetical protein